jgi:hypothetical protein
MLVVGLEEKKQRPGKSWMKCDETSELVSGITLLRQFIQDIHNAARSADPAT